MGYNNQSNTVQQPQGQVRDDSWKAQGFLNLYLMTKDGKKMRLGESGIPLKDSNAGVKELREWLEKDPANASKLLTTLIVEYRSATPTAGPGFVLPV